MRIVVLGAAAGGGFPQWNSNAVACRRARAGDPSALPRTQASIAVSADERHWFLFNAAPDLLAQIERTPVLHPREGLRDSPIAGVVLTGGDIDAIAGLLNLRERHRFTIHGTAKVLGVLDANPVFEVLDRALVSRLAVGTERTFSLVTPDGAPGGLSVTLFPVPGKIPLYLEGADYADPSQAAPLVEGDETVGAAISDGRETVFYVPGCARMSEAVAARLQGARCVFFDGTLFRDDEMIMAGVGRKTGGRMGHMSVSGPGGTMAAFAALGVQHKILIHINNTNPILLADSPERAIVQDAGWVVAHDGMEVTL